MTTINPDDPVFLPPSGLMSNGFSIRAYLAGFAMQGFIAGTLAKGTWDITPTNIDAVASRSLMAADSLIAALNQTP